MAEIVLQATEVHSGVCVDEAPAQEPVSAIPATVLAYLEDTYKFEGSGILLQCGAAPRGNFLIFSETVFYPKGGGQPSDYGIVRLDDGQELRVTYVEYDGPTATVSHYLAPDDSYSADTMSTKIGTMVTQVVDATRRLNNAKAHTAGHVLSDLVSGLAPEIVGKIGFHDSSEGCYVKFQGLLTSLATTALMEQLNSKLTDVLSAPATVTTQLVDPADPQSVLQLPAGYTLPEGKPCRLVQIEGFAPSPCGGTHISNLSELREIRCTKVGVVKKENITKISYLVV